LKKLENELTWKDLEIGCIVTDPGSTREYRTGDWRSQRPTYDFGKCIKCGLCAILLSGRMHGKTPRVFSIPICSGGKGCGICSKRMPTKVISMVNEEHNGEKGSIEVSLAIAEAVMADC